MPAEPTAPLLITGMHRSGTSMVARLLNFCGLSLGPEKRLMPPGEGNPSGFWQNLDMDAITEEVLATLSGEWDFLLPPMPDGWEQGSALAGYRQRAREQAAILGRKSPWGWKDPRASLTIPFWSSLLPGLRTLIVLRHPVETARSLEKRVSSSPSMAHHLWLEYYRRILADTDPGRRLVTHYDSFFLDPDAELERIVGWAGLEADENARQAALASIAPHIRQQSITPGPPDPAADDDGSEADVPADLAQLYDELCGEAGPVLQAGLESGKLSRPQPIPDPSSLPTHSVPNERMVLARQSFDAAHMFLEQGNAEQAILRLQEAATLDPWLADAQNDLGVLLLKAGEVTVAEIYLRLAVGLRPDDAGASGNLAAAYISLGRTEDAIKTYLALLERQPENVDALTWLASVANETGNVRMAIKYAERAVKADPGNESASQLLAKLQPPG